MRCTGKSEDYLSSSDATWNLKVDDNFLRLFVQYFVVITEEAHKQLWREVPVTLPQALVTSFHIRFRCRITDILSNSGLNRVHAIEHDVDAFHGAVWMGLFTSRAAVDGTLAKIYTAH